MLAKLATELPAGRRLALRAEVGRLPRHRVPRRRPALHPEPRPEAARPLLPRARGRASRASLPERCVVDGEIVIAGERGLDFDALQMRLHPAASRVQKLAAETPASFVAFDLLADGERDLRARPAGRAPARCSSRRSRRAAGARPPDALPPRPRGGRGVVPSLRGRRARRRHRQAREHDLPARQARDGQGQARAHRGLRRRRLPLAQAGPGHARRLAAARALRRRRRAAPRRRDLVVHDGDAPPRSPQELEPLREDALAAHPWRDWAETRRSGRAHARRRRAAGARARTSRGSRCAIERVCEVKYDHLQGDRFRHAAVFLRWRPDKRPADCRYDQLEVTPPAELAEIFARPPLTGGLGGSGACREGCDARRLARLLGVVRRPGRVAEARGLLLRRTARAARRASPLASMSACRSPSAAKRAGMVRSVKSSGRTRRARPRSPARRRARRASGGPSTRRRRCGPWRSGCSRGRRRGAPPSTTCWWRGAGARRSTSRASASAARRTSVNDQRGWMRTLTWMPREPEVFGQPTRPTSSRTSPHHARHVRRAAPTRRRASGRGRRAARRGARDPRRAPGCGCSSRQPRLAIQASAAASRGTTSSAVRPDGKLSVTTSIQSAAARRARASGRRTRRGCRRRSGPARWAGRPPRAARPRPPPGSSAPPRAW